MQTCLRLRACSGTGAPRSALFASQRGGGPGLHEAVSPYVWTPLVILCGSQLFTVCPVCFVSVRVFAQFGSVSLIFAHCFLSVCSFCFCSLVVHICRLFFANARGLSGLVRRWALGRLMHGPPRVVSSPCLFSTAHARASYVRAFHDLRRISPGLHGCSRTFQRLLRASMTLRLWRACSMLWLICG